MTDEQFNTLCKKLDKQFQLLTKIAKALQILPITEKEAVAIQRTRLDNAYKMKKAYEETQDMLPVQEEQQTLISTVQGFLNETSNIYADLIGDDI